LAAAFFFFRGVLAPVDHAAGGKALLALNTTVSVAVTGALLGLLLWDGLDHLGVGGWLLIAGSVSGLITGWGFSAPLTKRF
jgi:hypothetical protein